MAITEVNNLVNTLIAKAVEQQTGLNDKQEFLVNINKITIENLYITLMDNSIPHQEVIFTNVQAKPDSLLQENIMSVAAAKLVLSTLEIAKQKLEEQQ